MIAEKIGVGGAEDYECSARLGGRYIAAETGAAATADLGMGCDFVIRGM